MCSATRSLCCARDGRSALAEISISSDPSVAARVRVLGKVPAPMGLSSVQDWLSVPSEILSSSDVAVPASAAIPARVVVSVGILLRILARIRIPVRIKARFRVLAKSPASIRIPVRMTTSIRVSPVVRILQ